MELSEARGKLVVIGGADDLVKKAAARAFTRGVLMSFNRQPTGSSVK
jgi:hypothetical protein